jgi:hypothetical protein
LKVLDCNYDNFKGGSKVHPFYIKKGILADHESLAKEIPTKASESKLKGLALAFTGSLEAVFVCTGKGKRTAKYSRMICQKTMTIRSVPVGVTTFIFIEVVAYC